jgi:hypothetical protein
MGGGGENIVYDAIIIMMLVHGGAKFLAPPMVHRYEFDSSIHVKIITPCNMNVDEPWRWDTTILNFKFTVANTFMIPYLLLPIQQPLTQKKGVFWLKGITYSIHPEQGRRARTFSERLTAESDRESMTPLCLCH